jgi:hypothetical protein
MTNNLFLVLKKEWYDKIASGEKRVEYSEYTPYWKSRLPKCEYPSVHCYRRNIENREFVRRWQGCQICSMDAKFQTVEFQRGYLANIQGSNSK